MASVYYPLPGSLASRARPLVRRFLPLAAITLTLVLVAAGWWPRSAAVRMAKVAPAGPARQAPGTPEAPEASEDRAIAGAVGRVRASTVALEYNMGDPSGKRRVATGVVFSAEGDVISVRVEPPAGRARDSIVARDSAGHEHPARWVAADPETGLTLLRVEADDIRPIRPIRPTARAALLGAVVFLIGHPYDLGQSVSLGNVAGLNRRVKYGPRPLGGLIQVQVALHPGDSGALLADRQGGWLGLIRGGLATPDAKDDNNLGFAITAPDVLWVAEQLLAHRKVDRAYLGIKLSRDPVGDAAEVVDVVLGSPAEKAGLQPGDRVIALDEQPVRSPDDLTDRLDRIVAGAEVVLDYARTYPQGPAVARIALKTGPRPEPLAPKPTAPGAPPAP